MAKSIKDLITECQNRNLHVSIDWQRSTDLSLEIYKGYISNHKELYRIDGQVSFKKLVKKGFKFLKKYDKIAQIY